MDNIVCAIRPFTFKQEIMIYKNGKCIQSVKVPLKEVKNTLYSLCKEYGIKEISLTGDNFFCYKIRKEFNLISYDANEININIF